MGARITKNNFAKAKRQVEAAMERAEQAAAEDGVDIVKSNAPIDLNEQDNVHLIESIKLVRDIRYTSVVAGGEGTKVNYAGFVEFGTEKTGAQPYMGPAVPIIMASFQSKAREELRRALA